MNKCWTRQKTSSGMLWTILIGQTRWHVSFSKQRVGPEVGVMDRVMASWSIQLGLYKSLGRTEPSFVVAMMQRLSRVWSWMISFAILFGMGVGAIMIAALLIGVGIGIG